MKLNRKTRIISLVLAMAVLVALCITGCACDDGPSASPSAKAGYAYSDCYA